MGKAKILCQRLVKDAERMRKVHAPVDFDVASAAHAPSCASEIAKAIDGDHHGFIERRDVERRGEMGEMMLDMVQLAAKVCPGSFQPRVLAVPARARRFLSRLKNQARSSDCLIET